MKKAFAIMLAVVMVIGMLAGCSSTTTTTTTNTTGTDSSSTGSDDTATSSNSGTSSTTPTVVTMALSGSWDSLCPLASTTTNADTAVNTIFENLFESDGNGGYIGRLGESYEITDDNTALVVHLRQDAVWHDGEPFTADDVIFSAYLTTDGSFTSSRRLFFQQMEGCTASGIEESEDSLHIEKIDDYTVKFYYRQAMSIDGMFGNSLSSFFIFPEHLLKDADPATILENDFWQNPIGTGPFTYESNVPGESLTVDAFDDYYLGRPGFDKLVIKVISSANLVTSMMSGEVDLISGNVSAISNSDFEMAAAIDGYNVKSIEGTSTQFLVLNNETFNTPTIRKAIAMMMDKETMIKAAYNGNASTCYSMFTNLNVYCNQDIIDEYGYSFDPDTAYQMLVDEGFDFDKTYVACINDSVERQAIMTVMQSTWEKYGMKLEIQTLDTQTCISTMREGGCDFWINGGASFDVKALPTWFIDWVTVNDDGSYGTFNLSKISDTKLMTQVQDLIGAVEEDDVTAACDAIQESLLTDYNYIYIVSPYINTAISTRLTGVDETQMLAATFNYYEWQVTE
jgi:peptide/nickel transport system substrate-binding protein